jgi:hypothetical protein
MNKKFVTFPIMVSAVVAMISPLYSQSAGFQIGQSQASQPAQPTQLQNPQASAGPMFIAPMASPIQPTGNPILPFSGTIPRQQVTPVANGSGAITILPPGGTVFVPPGTFVIESTGTQQGAFLSAPLTPAPTSADRSSRATNIGQRASAPDITRLALGTPREKVIEKYGNPIAFIMNMNGETLYFNGGVVVFIKDGVVAVPVPSDDATRR